MALTQLDPFRGWVVERSLVEVNKTLAGRIEIGSISGNIITGLNLHDARLYADSTLLLKAPRAELEYQLKPLLAQNVAGARLRIFNPTVRLVRNARDSIWNFQRITKPAEITDSVSTPFAWSIDVAQLEMVDGRVIVQDMTTTPPADTSRSVNFTHMELEDVYLSLEAHIEPDEQWVWIQNLAFNMPRPDIRLVELAGRMTVDTTGLTVEDLVIETSRSLFAINGHIDSVNIFRTENMMRDPAVVPLELELDARRISMLEVERLAPELNFLAGDPRARLAVEGTLNDLRITRMSVDLEESHLEGTARVQNMMGPAEMLIDANIRDSRLNYRDKRTYLPGIDLPDLAYLGTVQIRSASYSGSLERFTATIDATTDIGKLRGGAKLDISSRRMQYAADVALTDFDLEPVLGDPQYASDFTGRAMVIGSGTSLETVDARIRLESGASTVAGRQYRQLYVDAAIRDGGLITIDTLLAAFGGGSSTGDQTGNVSLERLEARADASMEAFLGPGVSLDGVDRAIFASSSELLSAGGTIDLRDPDNPVYDVDVNTRNVDLSKLTLDDQQQSSLSFTASIDGRGIELDGIRGTAVLSVAEGSFAGEKVPPFEATITLEQLAEGGRELRLESDIADATITGAWNFRSLLPAVQEGVNELVNYVSRKTQYRSEDIFNLGGYQFDPINAQYQLDIKDLAPLEPFLGGAEIDARGQIKGEISGTRQTLSITANADLTHLDYSSDGNDVHLRDAEIDVELRNITPGHIEDLTSASISIRSDSAIRISDMSLTIPQGLNVTLEDGQFDLHGVTAINDQITVAVDGRVNVRDPGGYRVYLDTLIVNIVDGPSWRNIDPIEAVVSADRVRIDTFRVRRRNAEVMSISGSLVDGSKLENVVIRIEEGSVENIINTLDLADAFAGDQPAAGTLRQGLIRIDGTLDAPVATAEITIDSMRYGDRMIGNFTSNFSYRNRNLRGRAQVYTFTDGGQALAADIDVIEFPIDLGMSAGDERIPQNQPIRITAMTNDLPVVIAAPFVTGIKLRSGTLDLSFNIGGTLAELDYGGQAELNNVRALVEGNNILYQISMQASFQDDKLVVTNGRIRNDPRELANSGASIRGEITFDGFTPAFIDLEATIDRLLVLSDATQAVNDVIYGDLVIRTGNNPLRFYGTLDRPNLTGDVVALGGDLTIPYDLNRTDLTTDITYVDYDDWVRMLERPFGPANPFDLPADSADGTTPRQGSLEAQTIGIGQALDTFRSRQTTEVTFLEKLAINIEAQIEQPVWVSIELSMVDKLRVALGDGGQPLFYQADQGTDPELTGRLELLDGSEFSLYGRSFDATGNLRFTGDITMPQLNIRAIYEGRRVLDDGTQPFTVIATVTGTPDAPLLTLSYSIDGESSAGLTQDQQQRNAIFLLLFNRTSDELMGGGGNIGGAIGSSVIGSAQSLLSAQLLEDAFGNIGFIRSIELDLGGGDFGDFGQARVSSVFQFGPAIFRYQGEVTSLGTGNLVLELPLSALADIPFMRRMSLQVQRAIEDNRQSFGSTVQTETYTIQLRIPIF